MPHVSRWLSPDGRRVAIVNRLTGDVWVASLQSPVESARLMAEIPKWTPVTSQAPVAPPLSLGHRLRVVPGGKPTGA